VAAAMLAGCGGSQPTASPPVGSAIGDAPHSVRVPSAKGYELLYSFAGVPDGEYPVAGLLNVNGTLYGTTLYGGAYTNYSYYSGFGTVFSLTTSATEQVLHTFGEGTDGTYPLAGLIDVRGTLYGTTEIGGYNYGTVFSITTRGSEKVLHNFASSASDGVQPEAGLVDLKGSLYGTTLYGGSYDPGEGTVFSITRSGVEKVLHSFGRSRSGDGAYPLASLIEVKGTLYGTTKSGGSYAYADGTVFSITTSGTEKVLHSFGNGTDGAYPEASLVDVKGTLYGTTVYGGSHMCRYHSCGTVFSITTGGTENVLYSFGDAGDGTYPVASLIDVKGALYGTTESGGRYDEGTVFRVSLTGKEKVLHSFGLGSDGVGPLASLIDVNGTLYGTTSAGGAYGDGTIFALKLR
jgi:uncharacterized repeat protein (TIGR03803 family)